MFAEIDLFMAAGVDLEALKKTRMVVFEKGNAPSVQAVITGDVQFAGGSTAEVAQVLATKRVRVLGVNSPERVKAYPDIPTAKEVGYPKADIAYWHGVSGTRRAWRRSATWLTQRFRGPTTRRPDAMERLAPALVRQPRWTT